MKTDDHLERAETIELRLGAPTAAVLGSETQHVVRIVDLGGPLTIGARTIPEIEIKRALIYGPGRVAIRLEPRGTSGRGCRSICSVAQASNGLL